jgi:hypothetical protein
MSNLQIYMMVEKWWSNLLLRFKDNVNLVFVFYVFGRTYFVAISPILISMNEVYASKNIINLNVDLNLIQVAYKSMQGANGLHQAENFVLVNNK